MLPIERIMQPMKAREIIRMIEKDGWYRVPAKGGHRQFKHRIKSGRVTIPGNLNKDVPPGTLNSMGTLNSIMKQAGIRKTR